MVTPTVAHDITEKCCANTGITIPVFKKTHTDYDGGRTADGNKITKLIFHSKPYAMEFNQSQNIRTEVFVKN